MHIDDKNKSNREEMQSSQIYLHMESDSDEQEIDLLGIVGHMKAKRKLYCYILLSAVCIGVIIGLTLIAMDHIKGEDAYAKAVVSFQYQGIEEGLDPNGAAFDINKIKSPSVIEEALNTLGVTEYTTEEIRENISIEGVIPEDAVERITVIKEMSLENISNYEKILDVSYFPSQYVVYLNNKLGMSSSEATQILDAVLESYRTYFLDTYANTEVLTVTGNLIDYTGYDYAEALDMLRAQIDIMLDYVNERGTQAPEFRSAATGLAFNDIATALDTVNGVDIANLSSYIESHTLTKDKNRQREYYEYKIKKYNMDIAQCQVELNNIQSIIDKYQKDPIVIVSSQETTQQFTQTNEYYDTLLQKKLDLSNKIADLNTDLNEAYTRLAAINNSNSVNSQDEYDYADGLMAGIAQTIAEWADLTEQTTEEYYTTTLFSNAYKIGVPAQYKAAGGILTAAKKIGVPVLVMVFAVFMLWCADGLMCELRKIREKNIKEL